MSTTLEFDELFKTAAREFGEIEISELDLTQPVAGLGLDSIAMFEVIGFFEEKLGLRLPDEELAKVMTLQDLADVIKSAAARNDAQSGSP